MKIKLFLFCAIILISINAEIEPTKNEKQSGATKEVDVGLRRGGELIGGLNLVEYRGASATKEFKVIDVGMNLIGSGRGNGTENEETKKERTPRVVGRQNRDLQKRKGRWIFWPKKKYNSTYIPNKEEDAANKPWKKEKTRPPSARLNPPERRRWWIPRKWW
ncbi:uncharacterized protein [Cicer arietinum]|uniref:Uncharacterized protein LOC105852196 n=1 Tax=Cicer arietinum TaxID=3827 RepID=A0A1S3E744_CICAR|nr:uncharacterized protein LOC105852196 [Cicer arietinum]